MLKLATKFPPVRESMELAHRAGFRHAELWLDTSLLLGWRQVVELARTYPFTYALHFPNRLDPSPDAFRGTVELYHGLGCQAMVIHQPMFDRYSRDLLALDAHMHLAIENHKLDRDGLIRWAEMSPSLTLDVEHLWMFTLIEAKLDEMLTYLHDILHRYRSKLRHIHLPGYWPGLDEHRPMYASREMVFPVLAQLAEIDYQGLVVSEVMPECQNPFELRMDVLLFDRWRELQMSR